LVGLKSAISELAEETCAEPHAVLSAAGHSQLQQVLLDLDEPLFELTGRLHDLGILKDATETLNLPPQSRRTTGQNVPTSP
jgi:hypothetical protein